MILFSIYKPLQAIAAKIIAMMPMSPSARKKLISLLLRFVPSNRKLLRGITSPLKWSIEDTPCLLHFRPADFGDLGIVLPLLRDGAYEPEVGHAIRAVLRPGDVFIDGGAHIGYMSILAAHCVGSEGKIFSFEPFSRNFDLLVRNCEPYPSIAPINQGLWSCRTTVEMSVPTDCSVSAKRADAGAERNPDTVLDRETMTVTDLDSFCRDNDISPALLKLDIEGAEMEAFKGMQSLLAEAHPALIVEINTDNLSQLSIQLESFFEPLIRQGYDTCEILTGVTHAPMRFRIPSEIEEIRRASSVGHSNCLITKES